MIPLRFLVYLSITGITVAFKNGAPPGVCSSMIPGHRVPPQYSPYPYKLEAQAIGKNVHVTISSKPGDSFAGFFLQVRNDKGSIVGTFLSKDPMVKVIDCLNGRQNAGTHTSNDRKTRVTLIWKPEKSGISGDEDLRFMLTTVRSVEKFWVNQTMSLRYKKYY